MDVWGNYIFPLQESPMLDRIYGTKQRDKFEFGCDFMDATVKETIPKALVCKLAEIMGEVERIPKNGWNENSKYKYCMESDVVDAIRQELSKRKVILITNQRLREVRDHESRSGNKIYITYCEFDFTFYDGETGEILVITNGGEGSDSLDKGLYKAITGAKKYVLMNTFLIPTGDDPEKTDVADKEKKAAAAPKKDLRVECQRMMLEMCGGNKAAYEELCATYSKFKNAEGKEIEGKRSLKELTDKHVQVVYGKVKEDYANFQKAKEKQNVE